MKNFKKVLALVLVVATLLSFAMVARAASPIDSFTDGDEIDNTVAVEILTMMGIIDGYPDKTFKPNGALTRAEAAKLIAILANGSTDIKSIYASANNFVDVAKGSWAESYIAYCAKSGIVAGVGNMKFDPNSNVTNGQFLKMALVCLGLDSKKEGFESNASWLVNVIETAKDVGLLNNLTGLKTMDFTAPITRQNACQVMLNALTAPTFEYGYEYKPDSIPGELRYVTIAGAVETGEYLNTLWGLATATNQTDCFGRPCTVYTYKNTSLTVYATPVAEWTTPITMCDVAVAAGYAVTNVVTGAEYTALRNGVAADIFTSGNVATCKHDTEHVCALTEIAVGGQGVVTELYKTATGKYTIVMIDIYLGVVSDVKTSGNWNSGHLKGQNKVTVKVWDATSGSVATTTAAAATAANTVEYFTNESGFAKGDKVLVTYCQMAGNDHSHANVVYGIEKAESKTGKLTGFADTKAQIAKLDETEIDFVETPDAANFYAGKATIKELVDYKGANLGKTYTFYFDPFGNVIGAFNPAPAAAQYTVIDRIWSHAHENLTITANLVKIDASKVAGANVSSLNGVPVVTANYSALVDGNVTALADNASNKAHENILHTYTVDAKGGYALVDANATDITASAYVIKTGEPAIYKLGDTNAVIGIDAKTQFLFKLADGKTYVAYTGYKNVPNVTFTAGEYIDALGDGFADVVYATGVAMPGAKVLAYTFENDEHYTTTDAAGIKYEIWTVWVDGKQTKVMTVADSADATFDGPGFYELTYKATEGIVVTKSDKLSASTTPKVEEVDVVSVNGDILTLSGYNPADVAGIPVYVYDTECKAIWAGTTADLDDGEGKKVTVVTDAYDQVVAFYVYIKK